jgi:F-type H+-transporting ATPase subunit b
MEIFKTFGLDPIIIVAQIVNFLVILYILKRFLYKPLFKMFKQREELVKDQIEKAKQAQTALEKAESKEKELIQKAQETAKQMLRDAKEQSSDIIKAAETSSKKQTDQMIAAAKEQIAQETKAAEAQLTKHVSTLAIAILKKALTDVFSKDDQEKMITKALKEFKK